MGYLIKNITYPSWSISTPTSRIYWRGGDRDWCSKLSIAVSGEAATLSSTSGDAEWEYVLILSSTVLQKCEWQGETLDCRRSWARQASRGRATYYSPHMWVVPGLMLGDDASRGSPAVSLRGGVEWSGAREIRSGPLGDGLRPTAIDGCLCTSVILLSLYGNWYLTMYINLNLGL